MILGGSDMLAHGAERERRWRSERIACSESSAELRLTERAFRTEGVQQEEQGSCASERLSFVGLCCILSIECDAGE